MIAVLVALSFWTCLHFICPQIIAFFLPSAYADYAALSLVKKCYWRRLVRSEFYYILAAATGAFIFSGYPLRAYFTTNKDADPVGHLLTDWTPMHDTMFAIACGHWILSIYEDYVARSVIAADMDAPMLRNGEEVRLTFTSDPNAILFKAYMVHHVLTAAAYAYCLWTQRLGALCVMGLLFEAPVVLLNIREFIVVFNDDMHDLLSQLPPSFMPLLWRGIYAFAILFRYNSILIYLYSLIYWRADLSTVLTSWFDYLAYHVLGSAFTCLNLHWSLVLLKVWHGQDLARVNRALASVA